jgi:uridylate kinase
MAIIYKRVLLKLSGEVLAGTRGFGIDPDITRRIVSEIAEVVKNGVETGIVIGGGNIIRGATAEGVSRVAGDTMGMLATVINSLALKSFLNSIGIAADVLTAVHIDRAGELFTADRACELLDQKHVVIIAGGTGNPFFTTDTAAALRCAEIGADVLLKATKVDGIYDADPMKNPSAKRFDSITHEEALAKGLKVMDATAFSFCLEQNIPIIVFKLLGDSNFRKCVNGETVGTLVKTGGLR